MRVEHLTKRYGPVTALDGVTFSVRPDEILGLIGPNGSGKTTLFECLGGVLPFDSGRIAPRLDVSGQPLMFYLPDGISPWPDQTVRWMLDFAVGFFGGDDALRPSVVSRLQLDPFLDQPIQTLSKGQRKRALLGAGLLTPHRILLADEPFDGLDLRQAREAAALLRDTANRGRTLFLSIHQISDAARVCDRFVLLSAGRVCGEGTLDEFGSRNLEEVFLAVT